MSPRYFVRAGRLLPVLVLFWLTAAQALMTTDATAKASRYRADLVRIAHATAGLDAPVPLFAAQIHQESGWNPGAVSRVGARGMAQFMPATAKWRCDLNGQAAEACSPQNPTWAMRALIGYDLWLYQRVRGQSEADRWWAALRSYNGGLGHWQAEAAKARPATDRAAIDAACGKAKRHPLHCKENLDYPRRIMQVIQPRYQAWGRAVLL